MKRRLLAVSVTATIMAVLGLKLMLDRLGWTGEPTLWPLYVRVAVVSNAIWLYATVLFVRRRLPLWKALVIGLASPILGAVVAVPLALAIALRLYYICFPVGVATAYVVWRIATSDWHRWSAPAGC